MHLSEDISLLSCLFLCVVAAYELTLAEGNRLEKRLFHATFATVSREAHLRANDFVVSSNVSSSFMVCHVFPCRTTVKKAWRHLWRRDRLVSRTTRKELKVTKFLISADRFLIHSELINAKSTSGHTGCLSYDLAQSVWTRVSYQGETPFAEVQNQMQTAYLSV